MGEHEGNFIVGANVAPCVVGETVLQGDTLMAQDVDAALGKVAPGGDVPAALSMASYGKTLGRALGIDAASVDGTMTLSPYKAPVTFFNYPSGNVLALLMGRGVTFFVDRQGGPCYVPQDPNLSMTAAGDDNWRLVTFATSSSNVPNNTVLDLDVFRSADTVTFRVPRVGFFTSPGFFAQWPTNVNNQLRTTIN